MSWITITAADLDDTKIAALLEATRTAALASGQADPTSEIIAGVLARVRAEVQGCARNSVDADPTLIPPSLRRLACRMVVFELMGRLQVELTEDERAERRADLRYLERVAACEVPVEPPSTPTSTAQAGTHVSVANAPERLATRQTLRSL